VVDDETGGEVFAWQRLMVEAGVSPRLRRFHNVLWYVLLLLIVAAVALVVVGFFVSMFSGSYMIYTALAVLAAVVVLMIVASLHRSHLIRAVRWTEGTVTFHTVEPQGVSEDGQYVVCQVTVHPPAGITRVGTYIGPLDAQRLVVGATMRCLIDRNDGFKPLRVFPYATPDAPLLSGRVLNFNKA
jgi:hypothetical protein